MIVEKVIIKYLMAQGITGDNVFAERPETTPEEYILVERTGGGSKNYIRRAMVAVQSVSKVSMLRAAVINETVKEAMEEMPGVTPVFSCKLNSDYNFTNTATKEYRYQAVFNLTY